MLEGRDAATRRQVASMALFKRRCNLFFSNLRNSDRTLVRRLAFFTHLAAVDNDADAFLMIGRGLSLDPVRPE
jgi:hypothetical protein